MTLLSTLKQNILKPVKRKQVKRIGQALGVITKKDTLWFGKYKGLTIKEVLKTNPSYIVWLVDNTQLVFDEELVVKARKKKLKADAEWQKNHPPRTNWGNHWRGTKAHWSMPDDYDYDNMEWDYDCPGPWGEGA